VARANSNLVIERLPMVSVRAPSCGRPRAPLFFQVDDLGLQAADPFRRLLGVEHRLRTLLRRGLLVHHLQGACGDAVFQPTDFLPPRFDLVIRIPHPLFAHIERAAFVVGLLEGGRQVGGTDIVVSAPAGAGPIAIVRLAVFPQAIGASREVGVEVRRDAMLCAGAAVLADAVARPASDPVLKPYRAPVDRPALVLAHLRAAGAEQDDADSQRRDPQHSHGRRAPH
jgi:hypothetical protein